MNIELKMPTILHIGEGTINNLPKEAKDLGKKALIVTDTLMKKVGYEDQIITLLKENHIPCAVYDAISSEPTQDYVYEALKIFKDENCDYIITIGGGSCIDTAKAVSILATNDVTIEEIGAKKVDITKKGASLIVIPTTAGTGSEVTDVTVITNTKTNVKMMMKNAKFLPSVSIVDPFFTMTAPKSVVAASGLDALCHAVESYVSIKANEITKIFSLRAIKEIMNYLQVTYEKPEDTHARERMSLAATEAGIAFSNASVTLIHGMSRPIGAIFHITHGISNAMLLNVFLDYSKDAILNDLAEIAFTLYPEESFSSDEEAADFFISKVNELCRALGIPNFKEYGIDLNEFKKELDKMATDALASGSPQNNKKVPSHDEIMELYLKAYDYQK